jgi:hypothetical protein
MNSFPRTASFDYDVVIVLSCSTDLETGGWSDGRVGLFFNDIQVMIG